MESIEILVLHGTLKYSISIPNENTSEPATVTELAEKLEEISGVPILHQRLITKGKVLSKREIPLMSSGIKSGCKIVLVDKRPNFMFKSVKSLVESLQNKLEIIVIDSNILKRGVVESDFGCKMLRKLLLKRVKHFNEKFMESSEQFEAMTFKGISKMTKTQRRCLAGRIKKMLRRREEVNDVIQTYCIEFLK